MAVVRNRRLVIIIAALMAAALIFGVISAKLGTDNIGGYAASVKTVAEHGERNAVFAEALMKYGAPVILIWTIGFARRFSFVSFAVLAVRGAGIGYGFGALTGAGGLRVWFAVCFAQTIILVPAYIYITKNCVEFGHSNAANERRKLPEYVKALIIAAAAVLAAALTEAYITPAIVSVFVK